MHNEAMIALKSVRKDYQIDKSHALTAVKDVSLSVQKGEFVVITGRSGSGKTTLLNLIAGLTYPTSGEVWLEGVEICKLPDEQQSLLRNKKIGFVFQFPSLMPSLTVLENVMLPTLFWNGHHSDDYRRRALRLLEEVDLADKVQAYPRQLSAGQQQRVVVARSVIHRPELLLADEPTSNLDEETEREIMALFRQIHQQSGITILLVTHTTELVHYGTRAVRMAAGEIVEGELV